MVSIKKMIQTYYIEKINDPEIIDVLNGLIKNKRITKKIFYLKINLKIKKLFFFILLKKKQFIKDNYKHKIIKF